MVTGTLCWEQGVKFLPLPQTLGLTLYVPLFMYILAIFFQDFLQLRLVFVCFSLSLAVNEFTFFLPIHSRNFLYTTVQIAKDFTVLLPFSPWKLKNLFQTKPEHMCVCTLPCDSCRYTHLCKTSSPVTATTKPKQNGMLNNNNKKASALHSFI